VDAVMASMQTEAGAAAAEHDGVQLDSLVMLLEGVVDRGALGAGAQPGAVPAR
jgi:hypothetical protein